MAGIYFFDDFALDRKINVERRYYHPEVFSEEPYSDPGGHSNYPSLHWCPEVDKYRMWYHRSTFPERDEGCLAMAESGDAKRWAPAIDCGSNDPFAKKSPNVVFSGDGNVHGAGVYRDSHEQDPDRLYKLAGSTCPHRADESYYADCIVATSGDGINWNAHGNSMKWGGSMSDTYNNVVYNPVRDVYQVFHRASLTDRRIHCAFSRDLVDWSEPELLVHPDPFDPSCCQLYGMAVSAFDGIFIGMLLMYRIDIFDPVSYKTAGYVTTELAYSYDGFHWNRTHRDVVDLALPPRYGSGGLYLNNIITDRSSENWLLPASAPRTQHGPCPNDEEKTGMHAMMIYSIRPEAFAGLHSLGSAAPGIGNLLFKAIYLEGDRLTFNLSAPLGRAWFQICDGGGEPMPGFTFDDCVPFTDDSLAHEPQWKEHTMSELKGKSIRIELKMYNGILFAVHGDFRPDHAAVAQVSYGNPKMA